MTSPREHPCSASCSGASICFGTRAAMRAAGSVKGWLDGRAGRHPPSRLPPCRWSPSFGGRTWCLHPATAPPWGLMPVLRRARWGVFRCGEPPLQLVPLGSSPQVSTDHRGHRLQEPQDCSPGWAASPSYNHRSHGREPADAGSPQPAPAPWRHTDWREEVFCAPLAGGGRPRGPQRDRVRREAVLACVDELQGCCAAVSTGLPPHCSQ